MIDLDGPVRLPPDVRIHVVDDENGFIETPEEVRRLRGTGLRALADDLLPRLAGAARARDVLTGPDAPMPTAEALRLLETLGVRAAPDRAPAADPGPDIPEPTVAVLGAERLTRPLAAVLTQAPGPRVTSRGEPTDLDAPVTLVVVATASLFDPWAARMNALCVDRGQACLFYGLAPGGTAFVGPLWAPGHGTACFECLRTRLYSNRVDGATWQAYTGFLAGSGADPLRHEAPPWAVARLACEAARWVDERPARPGDEPSDRLLWFESGMRATVARLFAVPTCRVCGAGQRSVRPTPAPDVELTDAEDERVGIVHAVRVRRAESGPSIYLGGSTSADFALIKPPMRVTRNGGAGFNRKDAVDATIGETVERYAAGLYRPEDLRLASWSTLIAESREAVPPGVFGFFAPEQYRVDDFPFTPFDDETPVRWVQATRWEDDAPVWVPASQVYMHYRRVPGEAMVAPSISTGLAAGPSFTEAVLSGLQEVIERDALAVSWLHRLPPRPVDGEVIAASPEVSYHLRSAVSWSVRFHDLSLDLSPPVLVAVMDHHGGPERVMSFGSACRASPVRALEKAFIEAAQGLTYVRRLLRQYEDWQVAPDFGNVDEFNKHAILYSKHPELRARAGYLVDPARPPVYARPARDEPADRAGDPARTLDRLAGELRARGFAVYVVDLTTPDVRRMGVRVVRVLVPGLQQLSGIHRYRFLGTPRLREVVAALGFDSLPDNPYPHPLP